MENNDIVTIWNNISNVIAEEIENNPEFAKKIQSSINNDFTVDKPKKTRKRNPPKIDPFLILEEGGEQSLLEELRKLSIEELKDVIAANGMDSSKLAMKWKAQERLIDLILESTKRKASRGDAFWQSGKTN